MLDEDEGIFFKINMKQGLKILSQIVSKDELKSTYMDLIGIESFMNLKRNMKI